MGWDIRPGSQGRLRNLPACHEDRVQAIATFDLEDIERLAKETGFTTSEAIMINLKQYFPTGEATETMTAAIRDIVGRINR